MSKIKGENVNNVNNFGTRKCLSEIKCMYTNSDSLVNKLGELEHFTGEMDFDLIGITEVLPKNPGTDFF